MHGVEEVSWVCSCGVPLGSRRRGSCFLHNSRQRRRGKYLITKFVREGTYIDVVEREVPGGLDITDLEYYTLPPCANIQTTLCE
jgi:hypothetical protein